MSRNIRTLRDMNEGGADRDSGGESDGEGRQGFYVGGSETSGQQVLGPPGERGRNTGGIDLAERVFAEAVRNGAQTEAEGGPSTRNSATARRGVRLGDESVQHQDSSDEDEDVGIPEVEVRLIMWENGFSIDDGPLRPFDDPQNRQFLEHIMKGQIPRELLLAHPRTRINMRMERKGTPYIAPPAKPFQGEGVRLGAVVPDVIGAGALTSSSAAVHPTQSTMSNAPPAEDKTVAAQEEVKLDPKTPVTQVQIRLPNGQRLIGKFNHDHTVNIIRTFIVTAYPDLAFSPFQLMTTFPNKIIDDESITIKDAGLINSVVVIKPSA